jgi:hypothetical protein
MGFKHGTERGWRLHKERGEEPCDDCRNAKNSAWKEDIENRRSKPIPEGLSHGEYVHRHYGCNCEICMEASRAAWNRRKARRS